MAYNKMFIDSTFADNPKFAEYLHFKVEFLGYNKIEYIINYAAGCYNFDLDTNYKASDFKLLEDTKAYYHNLCNLHYEPELFESPFNSNSISRR